METAYHADRNRKNTVHVMRIVGDLFFYGARPFATKTSYVVGLIRVSSLIHDW